MRKQAAIFSQAGLQSLLEFTARVGRDPLLTQASTGNISEKIADVLWIKASGKWMADALRGDILTPLNLTELVEDCLRRDLDPAERYPGASLETAMHAALPHRVVLHVHCVDTIAWAVRKDAVAQLQPRLAGLPWQWIPYTPSGLPLARALERARCLHPEAAIFLLANHGLVLGGGSPADVEEILNEVRRRLAIPPRSAPPAAYARLAEICDGSSWVLPEDTGVHALGTDPVSQSILSGGLLYPCQALLSESGAPSLFRAVPDPDSGGQWVARYGNRPFLILEGRGVIVNTAARPAELAMISGLAHVVQRLGASAPLRYLTGEEIDSISGQVAYRYRELANASQQGAVR